MTLSCRFGFLSAPNARALSAPNARALSVALALASCRGTPPEAREPVVARIGTVSDGGAPTVAQAEGGTPARSSARRFELFLDSGACARIDGQLHCRQTIAPDQPLSQEPALLGGAADREVRSVAIGRDFACAVMDGGDVRCFGGNDRGQLGAGVRSERQDLPVLVPGVQGASTVFAGPFTACAILADSHVACWGKNDSGENGSSTNYLSAARELVTPEVVRNVSDVTSVAMAWDSTCAVTRSHEVHCWGRSRTEEQTAQRGDTNELPMRIDAMTGTTSLAANENAFCGVRGGEVVCFGETSMLIARNDAAFGPRGVQKVGVSHATKVSLGGNHGCALTVDGAVYCFGIDSDGALGVPGKGGYESHPPVKVPDLPRAIDVVCGTSMTCAITESDEVYCWGRFSWTSQDDVQTGPVRARLAD